MFYIALCDDERIFSKQVLDLLNRYSIQNLERDFDFDFRYFGTARELLETDYAYNILFLDIMLEDGKDGIAVGLELRCRGIDAVFFLLTSMERFQDGYKANVLRYLKKPLDPLDFFEAMDAAMKDFQIPRKRFAIKTKGGNVYVSLGDIIMADMYYRKRVVYTARGNYTTTEKWKDFSARLPEEHFYSPHKTARISFEHILESGSSGIVMDNGKKVSFSRAMKGNYANFNAQFQKYLGG